jgi:molecular chaperone DnaK (HSP70)
LRSVVSIVSHLILSCAGAALHAYLLSHKDEQLTARSDILLITASPFSLGLAIDGTHFLPVFARSSALPCVKTASLVPVQPITSSHVRLIVVQRSNDALSDTFVGSFAVPFPFALFASAAAHATPSGAASHSLTDAERHPSIRVQFELNVRGEVTVSAQCVRYERKANGSTIAVPVSGWCGVLCVANLVLWISLFSLLSAF